MKKTFLTKAFVAVGVMASALALSSMCVFAATTNSFYKTSDDVMNGTSVGGSYFTATSLKDADMPTGITSFTFSDDATSITPKKCYKFEKKSNLSFTTSGDATVEIVWSEKTIDAPANVKCDAGDFGSAVAKDDSVASYTANGETTITLKSAKYTLTGADTYTIKNNGNQPYVYGVRVIESTTLTEYTISGTSNLNNTAHKLTIGSSTSTVTTDDDGKWSATYSSTAAPESATLSTYGYYASADNDAATLTLTANGTALTASAANFTAYELADLSSGTYDSEAIAGDLTKFVATEDSWKAVSGARMFVDKTLSFKLSAPATVVVNAQSGSSEAAVKLALNGGTAQEVPKGAAANYTFSGVSGTNTLTVSRDAGGSDSVYLNSITITYPTNTVAKTESLAKPAVIADGTTYYAIAVISSGDADKSTVTISASGAADVTSSTVYSKVTINGVTYTASDLSTADGDYLFAFKVESASSAELTAASIQSAVSVAVA